jgi:hypothetical protein
MKSVLVNCDVDEAINFISKFIPNERDRMEILGIRNYRILMGDMFYDFVNSNTNKNLHMDRQESVKGGKVRLILHTPNTHYSFVCVCDH